jgi:hypothetical protein
VREPQTTETTREDQQGEPGAALILQNAMADRDAWLAAAAVDYVHMLRNVNAVFDSPFPHYTLDLLRAFPQAKLVLTDRNITAWYNRRKEFCDNLLTSSVCDAPFVLRPLQLHMNHQKEGHTQSTAVVLTRQQAIGAYQATRDVLSCVIDPERILRMNVWESPPPTILDDKTHQSSASPWFAVLAHFLNRTLLPDESQCNHIPTNAGHALRVWIKQKTRTILANIAKSGPEHTQTGLERTRIRCGSRDIA